MSIGLRRGWVQLVDHDPEWKAAAQEVIEQLWRVFGAIANDIQHIGSTSIIGIMANPIFDIAVAVDDVLENEGFLRRH